MSSYQVRGQCPKKTRRNGLCRWQAAIRSYLDVGFEPVGVLRKAERTPDGAWRDCRLMDLLAEELVES